MGKGGGGVLGDIFDNSEILWFIILFLLLFWCYRGYSCGTTVN